MAVRAPKPCNSPACGALSRDGTGYCTDHKAQASGWNAPGRGTRHERGYGKAWVALRAQILRRDKHLCIPCKNSGRITPAYAVDHIIPKSQGGTDDPGQLQAICKPCHKVKTQAESRQARP